jgi:hypothetical protein
MSSLVSCLFLIRVPEPVPDADCALCAAGACLSHHRPVLVDVEVDDGPLVAMLVHRIGLRLLPPAVTP